MRWLSRAPSPEKVAADKQIEKLDVAREDRKSALLRLLRKIDDIPIEEGIESIGRDIGKKDW